MKIDETVFTNIFSVVLILKEKNNRQPVSPGSPSHDLYQQNNKYLIKIIELITKR